MAICHQTRCASTYFFFIRFYLDLKDSDKKSDIHVIRLASASSSTSVTEFVFVSLCSSSSNQASSLVLAFIRLLGLSNNLSDYRRTSCYRGAATTASSLLGKACSRR
jgi:hypothetical protein